MGFGLQTYIAWIELWSSLLLGVNSLLMFTSKPHQLCSLNSCKMHCHIITPLMVTALNHIQMLTSDMLREC